MNTLIPDNFNVNVTIDPQSLMYVGYLAAAIIFMVLIALFIKSQL